MYKKGALVTFPSFLLGIFWEGNVGSFSTDTSLFCPCLSRGKGKGGRNAPVSLFLLSVLLFPPSLPSWSSSSFPLLGDEVVLGGGIHFNISVPFCLQRRRRRRSGCCPFQAHFSFSKRKKESRHQKKKKRSHSSANKDLPSKVISIKKTSPRKMYADTFRVNGASDDKKYQYTYVIFSYLQLSNLTEGKTKQIPERKRFIRYFLSTFSSRSFFPCCETLKSGRLLLLLHLTKVNWDLSSAAERRMEGKKKIEEWGG